VSRGRTNLFVIDRFDQAVRTTPVLHLRYESLPDERQRPRDAREFAAALPAAAVVLASVSASDTLELRLVRGTREDLALARLSNTESGPDPANVVEAAAALLAGECTDFTGAEPISLDCATGLAQGRAKPADRKDRDAPVRPPRGQFVSGLALASVGTALLVTGYGLLIVRRGAGDDWVADPGSLDAHGKWLNLDTGLIVTGSAGSALLVTAMPLVLPYKRKTPWWAWLSGGFGVAAAASSIAVAVIADPKPPQSCNVNDLQPEPCVDRGRKTDLAIMLGATAAPLLTMPLVYLLRKDDKKLAADLSPSIYVNRSGGALGSRGRV